MVESNPITLNLAFWANIPSKKSQTDNQSIKLLYYNIQIVSDHCYVLLFLNGVI